jgi:hypothetical protein
MGYIQADIKGEGGKYEWIGDRNDEAVFIRELQAPLIESTLQYFK